MNFEKSGIEKRGKERESKEIRKLFHRHIHNLVLKGKNTSLKLENNVWLAPLAGVTDLAFRLVCKECGAAAGEPQAAPGLVFTEMISAKGLHYKGNNSIRLADSDPREQPLSVQLFGSDPEIMAESALLLRASGCCAIDINMGCPMHKITANGEGSALLTNPALVENIVSAVADASGLPVTVKIRRGFETGKECCVEAALAAEAGGAAAVTVHGRFRDEYYSGTSNLASIASVKQAVKIPVIGNGDICSAGTALKMFEETGCDAIMIGRAALGRPWIFYELLSQSEAPQTEASLILEIIKRHIEYAVSFKGERAGIRELRKHLAWYTKGRRGAAAIREQIFNTKTLREALELVENYFTASASSC